MQYPVGKPPNGASPNGLVQAQMFASSAEHRKQLAESHSQGNLNPSGGAAQTSTSGQYTPFILSDNPNYLMMAPTQQDLSGQHLFHDAAH